VDFIVRPWTRTVDYWGVYWDLTRQVKQAFDAAGISIPYPQQDVHIKQVAAAPASPDRHPPLGTSSSMPPTDDAAAAMARGDG
jgi:small conductance mechanosensitive channel